MTDWRSLWNAVVAGEGSAREGVGWEFTSQDGQPAWAVLRDDGGPFPVFSSTRGHIVPSTDHLDAMTREAVSELLAAANLPDQHGWIAENISTALVLASKEVESWEGEEWALESDPDGMAIVWSEPDAARTPYAWLRAIGADTSAVVTVYQDDALFGLSFVPPVELRLPEVDLGSRRSRRSIPLVCGRINYVEVVYDTAVKGGRDPGLVTEVLLHCDNATTLLIAAEAYSQQEWHLFDESVVALTEPTVADALIWIPERRRWGRTEAGH